MNLQSKVAEYGPEVSDAEIVAALTAPDRSLPLRRVDIAVSDIRDLLLSTGEWAAVIMAATDAEPQTRRAAIILRETITNTPLIRTSQPAILANCEAVLAALVAGNVLSVATKDALLALADRPQSWAEVNGVEVTARSVALARGAN